MTAPTTSPGGTVRLAGRAVARVGFGAMQLAERAGRTTPQSRDAALGVLRHAVERGVNHIDTAQFYGDGTVNERIRAALAPYPRDLALVSKVGAEHVAGKLVPAQRPQQLRAGVDANLAALGIGQLAVVNLRRVDAPPGIIAEGDQLVDLDSQLAELVSLREEGKIAGIGLSNVSADQLLAAIPAGIACVQNSYSLLDRSAEPVLDVCREHGIAWVPFCPLGSAFPHNPKVTAHPAVIAAAAASGATPAQVGLAWLLARYPGTLLIPGTGSIAHLDENIDAGGIELDAATLATLDAVWPARQQAG
jgi:aryl-alcohol dehydrogenase-like predicted oxidoreductase